MGLYSHYDGAHNHPVNRALHMIAIPLGFSSHVCGRRPAHQFSGNAQAGPSAVRSRRDRRSRNRRLHSRPRLRRKQTLRLVNHTIAKSCHSEGIRQGCPKNLICGKAETASGLRSFAPLRMTRFTNPLCKIGLLRLPLLHALHGAKNQIVGGLTRDPGFVPFIKRR